MASRSVRDLERDKFDNKSRVKVVEYYDTNTFDHVKTTIGTTAKFIDMPEQAEQVRLIFRGSGTIYIGKDTTLTTSNGFPLAVNEYLKLNIKKGNNNNVYGIVASSTIDIYAIAMVKE